MICEPREQHIVWIDGAFVPWRQATMHLTAHHYGFAVFEGVRAYATEAGASIFRLEDHTARLFRSAQIMKIAVPDAYDFECLNWVQLELLRRNRLREAYLRPFVFYDGVLGLKPSKRDLSVHVAVLAVEWREMGAAEGPGLSLRTSSFVRHAANSSLLKAKANGNYVNGILALEEAHASGADEALLLDQNGYVTETSGANFFMARGGTLYTPTLAAALEGITRDTVFALAAAEGLSVRECQLSRDDVYVADEAFLTGTAMEIMPVRELDGRPIGSGKAGPITKRFRSLYAAQVRGRGDAKQQWLTRL